MSTDHFLILLKDSASPWITNKIVFSVTITPRGKEIDHGH